MGSIDAEDKAIQDFESEGIVGLGFTSLASVMRPSLIEIHSSLFASFSFYINPLPTCTEIPSQLIIGGGYTYFHRQEITNTLLKNVHF